MLQQQAWFHKLLIAVFLMSGSESTAQSIYDYPISGDPDGRQELVKRIEAPESASRIKFSRGSYSDWLRHYPLLPGKPEILLFNGEKKYRQDVHAAVLDLPLPKMDLQQCADAVMRMRAEYFFQKEAWDSISFNYTSGDRVGYQDWYSGRRPKVNGNAVNWTSQSAEAPSRKNFEAYLQNIFTYAGSHSLQGELEKVPDGIQPKPGDVLIQGGFPGHAVLIMDVAMDMDGSIYLLLAQSYMPAQQMHILKNLQSPGMSPWFEYQPDMELKTPEWVFPAGSLYRFP
jgi:hypothetical protein